MEAFSDGVFAIAITLLVLDIRVPELTADQPLLKALLQHWTGYVAFLVGFFTILICWVNHHCMFEYIRKSDGGLLLLNGFKLLVVSFTPFVTAVLSRYIGTPQQKMAVVIYAFNFLLMGSAMFFICRYAYRQGFIQAASVRQAKSVERVYALAAILAATIFILSFASTLAALILSCLMFSIFLLPKKTIAFFESHVGRTEPATSLAVPVLQEAE